MMIFLESKPCSHRAFAIWIIETKNINDLKLHASLFSHCYEKNVVATYYGFLNSVIVNMFEYLFVSTSVQKNKLSKRETLLGGKYA